MRKFLISALLSASVIIGAAVIIDAQSTGSPLNVNNFQTLELDNFDADGYWSAKYSKFRSINWNSAWGNIPTYTAPGEYKGTASNTNPDNAWIRWITDDEDPAGRRVIPDGLRDTRPGQAKGNVLGVRGNWDFPGYNWVILEPTFSRSAGFYPNVAENNAKAGCLDANGQVQVPCAGFNPSSAQTTPPYNFFLRTDDFSPANHRPKLHPYYIQMPGKAEAIDFWIWGKGYRYNLEVHVEDFHGNSHVLSGPSLNYMGWRNVRINIPDYIRQSQPYLPRTNGVKFLRFKITADPSERPDDFQTYLDYMQVLTDLYVEPFFGDDLVNHPSWTKPAGSGATAPSGGAARTN